MININFTLIYLELYLILINFIAFLVYGIDKLKAIQNNKSIRRVPENTLHFLAFIGGSIGAILSMLLFRHKIKKLSFMIKYFLILLIQGLSYYFIVIKDIIHL